MRMCNHHVKQWMQDEWGLLLLDGENQHVPGGTAFVATVT